MRYRQHPFSTLYGLGLRVRGLRGHILTGHKLLLGNILRTKLDYFRDHYVHPFWSRNSPNTDGNSNDFECI